MFKSESLEISKSCAVSFRNLCFLVLPLSIFAPPLSKPFLLLLLDFVRYDFLDPLKVQLFGAPEPVLRHQRAQMRQILGQFVIVGVVEALVNLDHLHQENEREKQEHFFPLRTL